MKKTPKKSKSRNSNNANIVLIAVGDRVVVDGKMNGTILALCGTDCCQVVMDGYDYSDNEAYQYHNIQLERCLKANCQ